MAVYIPISQETKQEILDKVLVTKNLINASNWSLSVTPSQDIILGIYMLSINSIDSLKEIVECKGSMIPKSMKMINDCFPEDYPLVNMQLTKKQLMEILMRYRQIRNYLQPINIPKNSKINNDTVALEAGRKRGSIKKSREIFTELIDAIEKATQKNNAEYEKLESKFLKLKETTKKYKEMYEKAINRELMYLEQINELEKLLKKKNSFSINNEIYGQIKQ
jgi:DNA-directed RNA polymerase beta' subunit